VEVKSLFSLLFTHFLQGASSYSTHHNYYPYRSSKAAKVPIILALAGYLYFEENVLSAALTQIQTKYFKYRELIKQNQEEYERDQYRKTLYNSFDPENRLQFLYEKIGKQLGSPKPFEGDFLSSYYDDRVQEIKENGAQIYFTQKGKFSLINSFNDFSRYFSLIKN